MLFHLNNQIMEKRKAALVAQATGTPSARQTLSPPLRTSSNAHISETATNLLASTLSAQVSNTAQQPVSQQPVLQPQQPAALDSNALLAQLFMPQFQEFLSSKLTHQNDNYLSTYQNADDDNYENYQSNGVPLSRHHQVSVNSQPRAVQQQPTNQNL